MAVDVVIAGLDGVRTRVLAAAVRRTLKEIRARDVLRIAVLPSDAVNRWDVGVRRPSGWWVTWFDSPVDDLIARVTDTLRQSA